MKIIPLLFTLSIGYLPISYDDVEINPLQPTPFNDNVEVLIDNRHVIGAGEPINLRVRSHPIGSNTYSESMEGMKVNPDGVTVLLIFNGRDRLYVTNNDCNPMVEQYAYFNRECQMKIPGCALPDLEYGKFVLHAIAINSYYETLKAREAVAVKVLNYGTNTPPDKDLEKALRRPYILYNEPYGDYHFGDPILLDFFLSEGRLSKDGNKVELYIDGNKSVLTDWVPYEILDLSPGSHKIKLVLVNREGKPYPSPFPAQESTIFVK